jgi:molybdopterin-containing oxidoreductase family iron-sulfur binding subunit
MPRWGMVIDLDKCTACQACVVACQVENNVPFVEETEYRRSRSLSWMKIVSETEGRYPDVKTRYIPRPCMHCDNPPCTRVCPVHATYLNPEGIVAQIYPRCIGCRFCIAACPYTVKYFNWYDYHDRIPAELRRGDNPDVSTRPKGVVEKCTFCHHRLMKAKDRAALENRPLRADDYVPACVESCPSRAMYFGDLADGESQVSRLARSPRAFRLLEELGTKPKVVYLAERQLYG